MAAWLKELLFDWVFILAYGILKALLLLVDVIESFFDVFAGTTQVYYQGTADFLINIFFADSSITNAFWAMALIAIALSFGFCIINVARKTVDVTGAVKQSIGQIMSNFFRCILIIISLNAAVTVTITASNVLLDRINYALVNASILDLEVGTKEFTDEEYAAMASILATVGNYSVNDTETSRYNVNSCFNDIRAELLYLSYNHFFDYTYPVDTQETDTTYNTITNMDEFNAWFNETFNSSSDDTSSENGTPLHSWQSAITLLANSANLTEDLDLDVYNESVTNAFSEVVYNLRYNANFGPVETAESIVTDTASLSTATTIFLVSTLESAQNSSYNTNPTFDDSLRSSYVNETKSWEDLDQVRKDFDIWEVDYLVGYVAAIVLIFLLSAVVLNFVMRLFNLLLLYVSAPLFVSSMPLDDGAKFQSWLQAFVIQLFSGFGQIISMRIYLIMLPIVASSDLVYFEDNTMNYFARVLMIIGGAWAVKHSSSVITGILAGNPGAAAIANEATASGKLSGMLGSGYKSGKSAGKTLSKAFSKDKDKNDNNKKNDSSSDSGDSGGGGSSSAPATPSRKRPSAPGKSDFSRNKQQQALHDQRAEKKQQGEKEGFTGLGGEGFGNMFHQYTASEQAVKDKRTERNSSQSKGFSGITDRDTSVLEGKQYSGGGAPASDSMDNSEAFSNLFGK